MSEPIRVFIGSGEASLLERKVLIHSLRKRASRPIDLYVFNGTHNAIEHNDEPPVLAPLSLDLKYRNFTEFSLYRYLIPEICQFSGKAIFLDSDIVCLCDVAELFDMPMNGHDVLAVPAYGEDDWATSVMLIDCAKVRFDLHQIFSDVDQGRYSYSDFSRFRPPYTAVRPIAIGPLEKKWNSFDRRDDETKFIHFTDLKTQPWKFPGHRYGSVWFDHFNEARRNGTISEDDINKTLTRGYARQDIRRGNRSRLGAMIQRTLANILP